MVKRDDALRFDYHPTEEELEWVRKRTQTRPEGLRVPTNFTPTAPAHHPGERGQQAGALFVSPQRTAFLDMLELPDLFLAHSSQHAQRPEGGYSTHDPSIAHSFPERRTLSLPPPSISQQPPVPLIKNEEEIELSLDDTLDDSNNVSADEQLSAGSLSEDQEGIAEAKRRKVEETEPTTLEGSQGNGTNTRTLA